MILVKKKRIALDRRRARNNATPTGLWSRISSVTQRPPGAESNFYFKFYFSLSKLIWFNFFQTLVNYD